MPKLPGIPHLKAVRAPEKAGFQVVRESKHIVDRFIGVLQRQPFDPVVWCAHPGDATHAHMVDDLLQSGRLNGATLQEAQLLLGPPSGNLGSSECALAYWIDTDRGWLCLEARDGRVLTAGFRPYDD